MRRCKREAVIRRAQNGFVLKVDLEVVKVYLNADDLLKDLELSLKKEPEPQEPSDHERRDFVLKKPHWIDEVEMEGTSA